MSTQEETTVKEIQITLDHGYMTEWSQASGDTYPADQIAAWNADYILRLHADVSKAYPRTRVVVEEAWQQMGRTIVYVDADPQEEEEVRQHIEDITERLNTRFWDFAN